jgi:hypothetical protein
MHDENQPDSERKRGRETESLNFGMRCKKLVVRMEVTDCCFAVKIKFLTPPQPGAGIRLNCQPRTWDMFERLRKDDLLDCCRLARSLRWASAESKPELG